MATALASNVRLMAPEAPSELLARGVALMAGLSGGLSGFEVAYEHYRGSYSNRVMWTPVVLSQVLLAGGVAGALSRRANRKLLPAIGVLMLADCAVGFGFHIRGIHRKPGGWKLLIPNVALGPPPFAPLLFGMSAYMGVLAPRLAHLDAERAHRLHRNLAVITAAAVLCSGTEALYSHYKNNFQYAAQWTPIVIAPLLAAAAVHSRQPKANPKLLPAASALAIADGMVGFFYHARGVLRRPGGRKHLLYNIMYGPPILAPLLFAACGALGLLASLMRARAKGKGKGR